MVQITKDERNYLVSKGVKTGENGIASTHCHYSHWYMAETQHNVNLLNKYRKSRYVK